MSEFETLEPISLGYSCDVKYQLSRNLFSRIRPHASETEFRNMLFRWLGQETLFHRHIFDWQITPLPAVRAYLQQDFTGVFDRQDLCVGEDGNVHHRLLETIYPHDFRKGPDGRMTDQLIDEQYAAARSKFDYLADRFRRHLLTPGPYLYVMGEMHPLNEVKALVQLLSARSPDHRFKLLVVDKEGAVNQVLSELKGQVFKGWLPRSAATKSPERAWEGDDAPWDLILQRFPLGLPGQATAAQKSSRPKTQARKTWRLNWPPWRGWRTVFQTGDGGEDGALRFVGEAAALRNGGGVAGFADPGPDDHFFSHFQPVRNLGGAGWARLTLDWPAGLRARVILQDQDCNWLSLRRRGGRNSPRERLIVRLPEDAEDVRLVVLPGEGPRSNLPTAIRLEIHSSGRPRPGLFS